MIKILVMIIIIILFLFLFKNNCEKFHEKEESDDIILNVPSVLPSCESCTYCDFNSNPQEKPYIISRCLIQHTTSDSFKPKNDNCKQHMYLSDMSGCIDAVTYYLPNIENLKNINDSNPLCKPKYYLDDKPIDNNNEKELYLEWINSLSK